jgi:hypothetical protein
MAKSVWEGCGWIRNLVVEHQMYGNVDDGQQICPGLRHASIYRRSNMRREALLHVRHPDSERHPGASGIGPGSIIMDR